MTFSATSIQGAFLVESPAHTDSRGWFARAFCLQEFAEQGISFGVEQINLSHNELAGTLRGLHFQFAPYAEAKLVRCLAGAVLDLAVDLRRDSPTFLQTLQLELNNPHTALLLPPGVAHGFQTLLANSQLLYLHSQAYSPAHQGRVQVQDPLFGFSLPLPIAACSDDDRLARLLPPTFLGYHF